MALLVLSGCAKGMSDEEVYELIKTNNTAEKLKQRFKVFYYEDYEAEYPYSVYDDQTMTFTDFYDQNGAVKNAQRKEKDFLYTMDEEGNFSQLVVLKEMDDPWAKIDDYLSALSFEQVEKTDTFYIVSAHMEKDRLKDFYDEKVTSASMSLLCDENGVLQSIQNETLTYEDGNKKVLSEKEFFFDPEEEEDEVFALIQNHLNETKEYRSCTIIVDADGKEKTTTQYNIAKGDKSGVVTEEGFNIVERLSVLDDESCSNDVTYYVTNKDVKEMEKQHEGTLSPDGVYSDDASGFVSLIEYLPDLLLEIRYASSYNFVGEPIDGYEMPLAFLSREAADALKLASADLKKEGYLLKIYDAYRPQKAVDHFVRWANEIYDTRMKEVFYPDVDKKDLIPSGYIADKSSHSRGSTLDLTLVDMSTGKELDMGSSFDFFGEISHSDYTDLSEQQLANRAKLKDAMEAHGFKVLNEEWWHFTLKDEPYPNTYFSFDIDIDSLD